MRVSCTHGLKCSIEVGRGRRKYVDDLWECGPGELGGCAAVIPDDAVGGAHHCEHGTASVWAKEDIRAGTGDSTHSRSCIPARIPHTHSHTRPCRGPLCRIP